MLLSLQGVRVSETPEGVSSLDLSRGENVNVEPGCSWPDPCDSNPCPANSYCSNDWDSYSCSCDPGMLRILGNGARARGHISEQSSFTLQGDSQLAQCTEWKDVDGELYRRGWE